MARLLNALLSLSLIFLAVAAEAGSIQGHVSLTKRLTKRKITRLVYELRDIPVKAAAEPEIQELDKTAILLEGPGLRRGQPLTARMEQKDKQFSPEILIITAGSTVVFPNRDPIFHNVFSLSKVRSFDLGFYPEGQSRSIKFDKPGMVQVYCHLHGNMSSVIVVAPSAWYTRPSGDGNFKLADIPAGFYNLVVWHKSGGSLKKAINVPQTGAAAIDVTIPVFDEQRAR